LRCSIAKGVELGDNDFVFLAKMFGCCLESQGFFFIVENDELRDNFPI